MHKMNCFAREGHVVDEDCFPKYLDAIWPVIKKALTLAALTSGFQTLLTATRNRYPRRGRSDNTRYQGEDSTPLPGPSRLATVEERILRLQAEFTQLAPDLLSTTTGLYQLKDSVGRLKQRLRARQARHRSHSLQE